MEVLAWAVPEAQGVGVRVLEAVDHDGRVAVEVAGVRGIGQEEYRKQRIDEFMGHGYCCVGCRVAVRMGCSG